MNTRSRKSMGLSHRMIALLLCCVCLFAAMPVSAIAAETENTQTESPVEVAETATATPSAEPGETGSEEGEEMASNIEDTGKTENGEVTTTPTPTETTAPAETEEPVDPVDPVDPVAPVKALYDSLMACKTAEEVSAILSPETEEEQVAVEALIAQFTEEQNAALTEKMEELGVYDTDILDYTGNITVTNSIETNGCLTVTYPEDIDDNKYTFTWEKKDGNKWVEVERKKVTGDDYNISEDGRSINVALDGGAQQTYRAKVATINGKEVTSSNNSNETKVNYYDSLQNGSFEKPIISEFEDQEVAGGGDVVWKTTADDIEIVNASVEGTKSFAWHGVSNAAAGNQCAEINASEAGALYQDVLTVPGSTMHWQLSHLGRAMNSKHYNKIGEVCTDTMYVLIMPYSSAQGITTQRQVENVMNNLGNYPGAEVVKITYTWKWESSSSESSSSDGRGWLGGGGGNGGGNSGGNSSTTTTYTMSHKVNGEWVATYKYTGTQNDDLNFNYEKLADPWEVHSGDYTVPKGQYLTRYFFVAGETANNDPTVGNHIDNVWFSTELPPANPGSISLTIQKTIEVDGWDEMSEEQKTAFKNSISFTTNLTGDTNISGSQMTWNGNVGTYNIQNYSIGTATSQEVTVTETTTDVPGYQLELDEKTWTKTINEGGVGKAEFTNKYTPSTVKLTIKKQISGNMLGKNDEFSFTVSGTSVADDDKTFTLKAGESKTITVNKGDEVTVTEGTGNYETTYKIDDGEEQKSNAATVNVTEDTTILFTNTKNVTIDTGVILDTLPYVLILAVVVVGAVVLVKKRRIREDD